MSTAIGIDLGTTFCCAGYLDSTNNVEIIINNKGDLITPSYVAILDKVEVVGKLAKEKIFRTPENVIYDSKRLIGRRFQDLQLEKHNWPFAVSCGEDETPMVQVSRNGNTIAYKPQEISALLLEHMKIIAEAKLGKEVKDVVITVPAYFNYHQRAATKEAGKLAKLNVLKLMNEPTAAALAYVHRTEIKGYKNILVFDLGGGTFDVSIVNVNKGFITVRATSGNTHLGGRDFDNNLSRLILDKIAKMYNRSIQDQEKIIRRINGQCEEIKIALSSTTTANASFISLFDGVDVDLEITRGEFETINMDLFDSCLNTVQNCLKDAQLTARQIDKVVLIGGSTRIPKVQQMLSKFFRGKSLTKGINPDEAVAYGAAVQAAMLSEADKLPVVPNITDVTPLSIGIDLIGGLMQVVIPRNSAIPLAVPSNYVTVVDKQDVADFNIYEGERPLTKHNTKIGTFLIELPPKPPGYLLEILFRIDDNGILKIGAKSETGVYTNLSIQYGKQSMEKTNNIIQDYMENKEIDNRKCNIIKKWRHLETYCTKMRAICTYDQRGIEDEEKHKIRSISKYYSDWLRNNEVADGSEEEEDQIVCMQKSLETVCESIVNKYGYYVRDLSLDEFHKIISQ